MNLIFAIIILGLLSLLLYAVEIFVTPGFGLPGISGLTCTIIAVAIAYAKFGSLYATLTFLVTVLIVLLLLWWFSHSRTIDKIALNTSIDSTNATSEQLSAKIGEKGTAVTRLALIGTAIINGKQIEVKSADGFLDEGTPVEVISVKEAQVMVKAQKKT